MAKFIAFVPIDMLDINFSRASWGGPTYDFYDSIPLSIAGVTYADTFEVYWNDGNNFAQFSGSAIVADYWSGTMESGTLTGIAEGYYDYFAGGYYYSYALQGIAVSAALVESAIATSDDSDDIFLIANMLGGADTFIMSEGDDTVLAWAGNDSILGYGGDDSLFGATGDDKIKGGNGDDLLVGDVGKDKLTGGRGDDWFAFYSANEGGDRIADFHAKNGDDDVIAIENRAFKGGLSGKLKEFQFQLGDTNHAEDNDVRFIFRTTDETLWFDKNGAKAGGLSLIADLQGSADVTYHDILII